MASGELSESERYVIDLARTRVWGGMPRDHIRALVDDVADENCDLVGVMRLVDEELAKKRQEEGSWSKETDCDRLDVAFDALLAQGIVALHGAGLTMSDGHTAVAEYVHYNSSDALYGYCFYHWQDMDAAVRGGGLMLAFGALNDDELRAVEIGRRIQAECERVGLKVAWSGSSSERIDLPEFRWQRRGN